MLLVTLALATAQPLPVALLPAPNAVRAAPTPCNPDAMKSIACAAQHHTPSARTASVVPIACNPDPLKGAACHAHTAQARAEARSQSAKDEELAAAD